LNRSERWKIENILYATDLSFAAERALPYAIQIAQRRKARIYAVHAIQPTAEPSLLLPNWPNLQEQEQIFREESRRDLEEHLKPVAHEIVFRTGDVWDIVKQIIQIKEIDLLVLSTHGRTGVERVLLGSVAETLFRRATCPVLTVGPRVPSKPKNSGLLSQILYSTDFQPVSLAAAPLAISLAEEHRAQLILLHCLAQDCNEVEGMRLKLRQLAPFGSDLESQPVCIVERGNSTEKILEIAEGISAGLIVLGIHGTTTGRLEEQILHPGVFNIVKNATCPVLTVRS
jgi:nucleotide-binding universal stress UspA family protein